MAPPCRGSAWASRSRSRMAAGRAASVALLALLAALGALPAPARSELAELARPTLRNHARRIVGRIEPAPGWPDLERARGRA